MNGVEIRAYRPTDRDALERLWSAVFADDPPSNGPAEMIDRKLTVQPELLLVADSAGSILGAVMAGFDGTRGWIHHLAVAPPHRGRGVGSALVRAAVKGLRALGCTKVNLQVREGNQEVISFYRSLGFEVEARVSMGKVIDTPTSDPRRRPSPPHGA